MRSRTKFITDHATVEKLFAAAGITGIYDIAPLGAGEFNAVFSAKAGGKEYALKIAPPEGVPVMTYEKNMMEAEVFWYGMMRGRSSIKVPEVNYTDLSKKLIPADYFIMEKLPGTRLDKTKMSPEEKATAATRLVGMAGEIHKIKNDGFGYKQNGLHPDWYRAIRSMVEAVLADCAAKGKKTKRGERLFAYIDRYRDVLAAAECSMVNFDIWPPNILCTRENGEIQYAWIDPERSFWGDRIADFVSFEMLKPLREKKATLKAYNLAADIPVAVTRETEIRFAVAQGYLALTMEIEKYYRYTPGHFGWWRNVFASKMLYQTAFMVLEDETK